MNDPKYVGCDVHLATIVVEVQNSSGNAICQAVIETKAGPLQEFFAGLSGPVHVAFEEGPLANWLCDLLAPLVAKVIVCNPRPNKLLHSGHKSDRTDAAKLARLLRLGELQPVYHGSASVRPLQEWVHHYNGLVSDATRTKNRIKALLRSRALTATGKSAFSTAQRQHWLSKVDESAAQQRLQFLYQQLDGLTQLRRQAHRQMLGQARQHSAYKRLLQVPGLGPIRVAELIAIVASPHRFRSKRQFWPYCGLAVVTRSTSDYQVVGGQLQKKRKPPATRGLNPNFNHRLKYIFKGAAVEAIKREPFQSFYRQLTERGLRPEVARVTVARKLAAISLAVWKGTEEFDAGRVNQQALAQAT